jgi:anti-sigma-K factor RskA
LDPNIDKQEIRSYLLGQLESDRRAALEERLLSDAGIYEELLLAEEELIDQYVANKLSPSERQQFETNFLITAERQKKLRFGRLLRRYLDSQPAAVPPEVIPVAARQAEIPAPAKRFLPFFSDSPFGRSASIAVSAAVVASIAILVFICWVSMRRPAQHTVQENSSHLVTVPLAPGSQRSEGIATPRVAIPPKGFDVRLELEVSNTTFRNYKSELLRENDSLKTADELKVEPSGEQHVVPWTITGDVLSPGDYKVRLSGVVDSGQDEFIDNYSFRVIK